MSERNSLSPLTKWVLFALALIALVFSFTQKLDASVNRIVGVYMNFGHVVAFFLWTYLCLRFIKPLRVTSSRWQFIFCVLFSLIVGTAIELIQQFVGREASVSDLVSDVLGALLAYLLLSNKRKLIEPAVRVAAVIGLVVITGFLHRYLIIAPINEYYQRQQFPVLFDPETPFETTRLFENAERKIINHEKYGKVLQVNFDTEPYSTISINYFPSDWENFSTLEIELFQQDDEIWPLKLRVQDLDHFRAEEQSYDDRFNGTFYLDKSEQILKLSIDEIINAPKERQMNINEMASIWFFTASEKNERTLFIKKIRLLK